MQDDILPKLMTSTGSYEDLFRKEIAKYDHICEEIAQNIEAQEQLLMQIQVYYLFFLFFHGPSDFLNTAYDTSRQLCFSTMNRMSGN